jgi:hypothetical protein
MDVGEIDRSVLFRAERILGCRGSTARLFGFCRRIGISEKKAPIYREGNVVEENSSIKLIRVSYLLMANWHGTDL